MLPFHDQTIQITPEEKVSPGVLNSLICGATRSYIFLFPSGQCFNVFHFLCQNLIHHFAQIFASFLRDLFQLVLEFRMAAEFRLLRDKIFLFQPWRNRILVSFIVLSIPPIIHSEKMKYLTLYHCAL